jgi:exodeoxyribonuclease VII large subunit
MAGRRIFEQEGELLKLSGDTFSIKEELKKLGARYDGSQKCWFLRSTDLLPKKLEFLGFLQASAAPSIQARGEVQGDEAVVSTEADSAWTVSQFTQFVERLFRQHLNFDFWIVGEISSLKSSSGHFFFELTEPEPDDQRALISGKAASVPCCLWAGKARMLADKLAEFPLADGVKVKLKVNCDFRKEGSRINLIVNDVDPQFTLGDLALKRQSIVRELKRRGLYDRQRSFCRWPDFPLKVALVTAAGSRAQTDFVDELKLSGLAFRVTLFDCLMQGEKVRDTVTSALEMINGDGQEQFDCVVITRGGGSRLDLRWFDDLEICKSIAYSNIPVMTAIGHFEDVSIADEVASIAEKTPTGAARHLTNLVAVGFDRQLARLERAARSAQLRVAREKQSLDRFELRIEQAVRLRLDRETDKLQTAARALRLVRNTAARPLKMGYSSVRVSDPATGQLGRHITADDFLTSEPPKNVQVQLWSSAQNAQVLVDMKVEAIRHTPLPSEEMEFMVEARTKPTEHARGSHGK